MQEQSQGAQDHSEKTAHVFIKTGRGTVALYALMPLLDCVAFRDD